MCGPWLGRRQGHKKDVYFGYFISTPDQKWQLLHICCSLSSSEYKYPYLSSRAKQDGRTTLVHWKWPFLVPMGHTSYEWMYVLVLLVQPVSGPFLGEQKKKQQQQQHQQKTKVLWIRFYSFRVIIVECFHFEFINLKKSQLCLLYRFDHGSYDNGWYPFFWSAPLRWVV